MTTTCPFCKTNQPVRDGKMNSHHTIGFPRCPESVVTAAPVAVQEGETPRTDALYRERLQWAADNPVADKDSEITRMLCEPQRWISFARQLERELTAVNAELRLEKKKNANSLANNLCPDHRDKQTRKPCLACEIERRDAELRTLREDKERLDWLENGQGDEIRYIAPNWYTVRPDENSLNPNKWSSTGQWATLRSAIDSARTKPEGRAQE